MQEDRLVGNSMHASYLHEILAYTVSPDVNLYQANFKFADLSIRKSPRRTAETNYNLMFFVNTSLTYLVKTQKNPKFMRLMSVFRSC
jgi:hypothetical protein